MCVYKTKLQPNFYGLAAKDLHEINQTTAQQTHKRLALSELQRRVIGTSFI